MTIKRMRDIVRENGKERREGGEEGSVREACGFCRCGVSTLQRTATHCNTLQHSEEDSVREACRFCECWASHTRSSFVVWYLYMFRVEGFRFTILALPNAQSYRLTTKCAKLPSPCAKLLSSYQSFWTFLNEQSADIHRNDVSGVGF